MIIIIIMTTLIINITTLAGGINWDKVVVVLARRNSLSEFCDWWPINESASHTQRAI